MGDRASVDALYECIKTFDCREEILRTDKHKRSVVLKDFRGVFQQEGRKHVLLFDEFTKETLLGHTKILTENAATFAQRREKLPYILQAINEAITTLAEDSRDVRDRLADFYRAVCDAVAPLLNVSNDNTYTRLLGCAVFHDFLRLFHQNSVRAFKMQLNWLNKIANNLTCLADTLNLCVSCCEFTNSVKAYQHLATKAKVNFFELQDLLFRYCDWAVFFLTADLDAVTSSALHNFVIFRDGVYLLIKEKFTTLNNFGERCVNFALNFVPSDEAEDRETHEESMYLAPAPECERKFPVMYDNLVFVSLYQFPTEPIITVPDLAMLLAKIDSWRIYDFLRTVSAEKTTVCAVEFAMTFYDTVKLHLKKMVCLLNTMCEKVPHSALEFGFCKYEVLLEKTEMIVRLFEIGNDCLIRAIDVMNSGNRASRFNIVEEINSHVNFMKGCLVVCGLYTDMNILRCVMRRDCDNPSSVADWAVKVIKEISCDFEIGVECEWEDLVAECVRVEKKVFRSMFISPSFSTNFYLPSASKTDVFDPKNTLDMGDIGRFQYLEIYTNVVTFDAPTVEFDCYPILPKISPIEQDIVSKQIETMRLNRTYQEAPKTPVEALVKNAFHMFDTCDTLLPGMRAKAQIEYHLRIASRFEFMGYESTKHFPSNDAIVSMYTDHIRTRIPNFIETSLFHPNITLDLMAKFCVSLVDYAKQNADELIASVLKGAHVTMEKSNPTQWMIREHMRASHKKLFDVDALVLETTRMRRVFDDRAGMDQKRLIELIKSLIRTFLYVNLSQPALQIVIDPTKGYERFSEQRRSVKGEPIQLVFPGLELFTTEELKLKPVFVLGELK